MSLDGVAIVTGGNSGVGLATAGALAKAGMKVFIACRSSSKAEEAMAVIREQHGAVCDVSFLPLDLNSLDSVVKCAEAFLELDTPLKLLVNNAGMIASSLTGKSKDGYERTLQVNVLGHYLLTLLLMPALQEAKPSKVVNVASLVHGQAPMDLDTLEHWRILLKQLQEHEEVSQNSQWPSRQELFPISSPSSPPPTLTRLYATSKLGNMLFSLELNRRFEHTGVASFSMCPGVVATDILKEFNAFVRVSGYIYMRGAVYFNAACTAETSAETVMAIARCQEGGGTYWTYGKQEKPHPYGADTVSSYRFWELCWDIVEAERRVPHAKDLLAAQRLMPLHVCGAPPIESSWKRNAIIAAAVVAFLAVLLWILL